MAFIGKDTEQASKLLLRGKLVAIPTETVYGLAANALDETAVLAIFEAKQRPHFDPLIIHVNEIEKVESYATWNDERLRSLAAKYWPGPLTVLLPKKKIIPSIVTSGLDTVAIRIPDHELTLALLKMLSFPLAAPSANPFGYVSPTTAQHVNKQLGHKVDYILDGGPCKIGLESTIVGSHDGKICVYRLGGLTVEEIEETCGKVELCVNQSDNPRAPGQLKSHYAPRKTLVFGDLRELTEKYKEKKIAAIVFGDPGIKARKVFYLSKKGSLSEAAINLFNALRKADESDAEIVIAGKVPDEGLGKAINDRLKRAAA